MMDVRRRPQEAHPALPQVPPKVRRHDREVRTHDERQRQRLKMIWPVPAGCGLGFDPLEAGVGHVGPIEDGEPGRLQRLPCRLGGGQEAVGGITRPWHRELQGASLAGNNVIDRQAPAGTEHGANAGIEPAAVGDVHGHMLHPGEIEAFGLGREPRGVTDPAAHLLGQPGPLRQHGREVDEGAAEVDAGDQAPVHGREVPGGTAKPASDVQQAGTGADAEPGGQRRRRHSAADMELVQRRQSVPGDHAVPQSRQPQRIRHPGDEIAGSVVREPSLALVT